MSFERLRPEPFLLSGLLSFLLDMYHLEEVV